MSDDPTARNGPRNVLLLAPAMSDDERACLSLSAGRAPERTDFLAVLYTRGPDDALTSWRSHVGELPDRLRIVSVGGERRASTARGLADERPGVGVDVVDEPRDLTGLAMRISGRLSEWDGEGSDVRLCFDSLTALVQYAELERAFRFLHMLTSRLNQMGAVAHFHLDPGAVDDRTGRTLAQLFDETVRFDEFEEADAGNSNRRTAGSPTDVESD